MKKNMIIWIFTVLIIGAAVYTVKNNPAPSILQVKSGTAEITTESPEKQNTEAKNTARFHTDRP